MQHQVNMFIELFTPLFKKGLNLFWEESGKMFSQAEYHAQFLRCRLDHKKFEDQLPKISYVDHVELRVLEKEMANLELPIVNQLKTIEKYGKTKYRMCG